MITVADLQAISGSPSRSSMLGKIAEAFNEYAPLYGVTHQNDIADALAHFSVETGGFRRLDENMNYSAKALLKTWPSRFNASTAKAMARKPKMIANHVYGGRMGNKGRLNAGWLYRGSGLGQVTGYNNFKRIEDITGLPVTSSPDMLRDPDTGTQAALILWQKWDMNKYEGGSRASRKKWNGGYHGLAEYQAAYTRAMKRRLSVPVVAPPPVAALPTYREERLQEVVQDAAATDRMSTTNIAASVTGAGSLVGAGAQVAEKVQEANTTFETITAASPWVLLALVCAGAAYYIYRERSRKSQMAQEALQ